MKSFVFFVTLILATPTFAFAQNDVGTSCWRDDRNMPEIVECYAQIDGRTQAEFERAKKQAIARRPAKRREIQALVPAHNRMLATDGRRIEREYSGAASTKGVVIELYGKSIQKLEFSPPPYGGGICDRLGNMITLEGLK